MCNHDWIKCGEDEMLCWLCGQVVKADEPAPSVTEMILPINQVLHGNSLEVLKTLEDNSVDSIVTDPPYELGFMGKKWDSTGIAYNVELWKECLRVLKPGGHLLAFGGTRTYHRMACAIEDAGFEIRDCIQWIYGSGFPKSHDISKAIDKKFGADPATPEAKQWEGWGTCLKPANEPIVLARKPLSEKTIADNVLKWGTGGLNIDGCRIGTDIVGWGGRPSSGYSGGLDADTSGKPRPVEGRFPANVILDEEAGALLDKQSGISRSSDKPRRNNNADNHDNYNCFGKYGNITTTGYSDTGGASRFFYCAKASRKERGEGNNHPTVKPIKLIEYLVTLITPPNGIVLDPFFGSGTTGIAAVNLGFNYIGIELDEQYVEIARRRINAVRG